jgi:xylulose-5-phosphate/fructose-6-phosphate phosphoketolase
MKEVLAQYIRAADYLSAIQIYLQDNFFLDEPLAPEHVKSRLLGHWGTCPGINFTYAHLNRAIIQNDLDMMFILGPGHGFPAIQANLFLEGTLSRYDERVTHDRAGIAEIARNFSWPYGYPSHSNPEAPGVVLEGGELGYSLATAYGTALDNPGLITACLVGDGEAETGPTATAWHCNKFLDPRTNGTVLPILHLNGYKISGPTVYGRMSDTELEHLFTGYGYEPLFVDAYEARDVHEQMIEALDTAISRIQFTQYLAGEGSLQDAPRWPMIILRTPKGWHSIASLDGKRVEDNHYSHQVIAQEARTNPEHLAALEDWLRSYDAAEFFTATGIAQSLQPLVPHPDRAMGNNYRTFGGDPAYQPLQLPQISQFAVEGTCRVDDPSCGEVSSMEKVGEYFRSVMEANLDQANLRLFSPDETYSNKLDSVFEITNRAFVWPHQPWDRDLAWDGRVMEMLSEHTLQAMLQGYLLTGRHGMFVSYEAFVQIVASMADQYAKFLSVAREVPWRGDVPSLNYIVTSSGWRQEHNGFSHQNPGFIDGVLQRQGCFSNVYFPADANTALVATARMLDSKNEINVLAAGKRPLPCWRTLAEAERDIQDGITIWDFASDENPHIVLASAGDYVTKETLAAINWIHTNLPELRMRYVNISSLSALGVGCTVLRHELNYYFTEAQPVRINFHGYPQTLKQILFDYGYSCDRVTVCGYQEEGSTTTPFDMMVRNGVDRYSTARYVVRAAEEQGVISTEQAHDQYERIDNILQEHYEYIVQHGDDPKEIRAWTWHAR